MNISMINGFETVKNVNNNQNNSHCGIRMSTPLQADTVSFSGSTIFRQDDDSIPPTALKTFNRYGVKTCDCYCLDKSENIIHGIYERRNEILTDSELMKYYGVSREDVHSAFKSGKLTPYGIPEDTTVRVSTNDNFMFDIKDKRNADTVKSFENFARTSKLYKNRAYLERICNANINEQKHFPIKSFPAAELEKQGYGSKEDLMANVGLHIKVNEIKKYILNNNNYDLSSTLMYDIIEKSRRNNPALVPVDELKKSMGEEKLFDAVIGKHISFLKPLNSFSCSFKDLSINLDDEKNLEYLKSVNDDKFQNWLNLRLDKAQKYKASNIEKAEAFKSKEQPKTTDEVRKELQKEYEKIRAERNREIIRNALLKARDKESNARNTSLRSTIAWTLSDNTRQVMRENSNPHIREIAEKQKGIKQIQGALMMGDMTYEEAEKLINDLNLTQRDKIDLLSFYKTCWEISGTEEWKQSLKEAGELTEIYNQKGIDGIDNEKVRERLIRWEQENGKKYSVVANMMK